MRKIKIFFRKKFCRKLSKNDIRAYRAILRLLYHKKASTPLRDSQNLEFIIEVEPIHFSLIINESGGEIINSTRVWSLNDINSKVFERAMKKIQNKVAKERYELKEKLRGRKQDIGENVYSKIR